MSQKNKVQLIKGIAFELDPNKKYMVCFDIRTISKSDVSKLINMYPNGSVAVMVDGDPQTAVKVIEETNDDQN